VKTAVDNRAEPPADTCSPTFASAGDLAAGAIDVALVGGTHPDAEALEAAGATWCFPEILPGATAPEALATAATPPG
jgi:hypothetical protein